MDKEGLTLEQIKEIYSGKINDTYTLNLAVAMLENYDELLNKLEEQDKEIERLNNIIKPKEVNYNYLKLLFEKKNKEEVIKSYVYKCEQLEKLYKSYEEKEIEVMKKDNIIDELKEDIEFCLKSIKQEYEMSTDERTRTEMKSCKQILEERLKTLKEGK